MEAPAAGLQKNWTPSQGEGVGSGPRLPDRVEGMLGRVQGPACLLRMLGCGWELCVIADTSLPQI